VEGPVSASAAPAEQLPPNNAAGAAPVRRKLKRSNRAALIVILILALLAAGGFGANYFINSRKYVSTDNAQIDGDKISINAPTGGTLVDWTANHGVAVHRDQVVGRVEMLGGFVQAQMPIRSPGDGTVAIDRGINGTYVTTGTELAVAYNLDRIYVTARVDETDIRAVRVGQVVDIYVDAFPHLTLTGRVAEIQSGAAAEFSLFPQNNTGGNFQKVTQVIPVKISFDFLPNVELVPGMNVTIYIHKMSRPMRPPKPFIAILQWFSSGHGTPPAPSRK
jgi:multidrug resistance efflux pump